MSDLSGSVIRWRGLTFYGHRDLGQHTFSGLEGWEERKGERDAVRRALGHGQMGSAPRSRGRTVLVRGNCFEPTDRDAVFAELDAAFALADDVTAPAEELTITHAGRTLTAYVWLTRWTPTPSAWGAGVFSWQAEFQSDDPFRYGAPVVADADFPLQAGGLRFPLYSNGAGVDVGALDYGATPTSGRLTLTNTGVARAAIQHTITGPTPPEGFEIRAVATAGRLVYEGEVPAGSTLLLDGATGLVLMDGATDRGDLLTHRDWPTVGRGESVELAFLPLGSRTAGQLQSTLRPPVW